MNTAHDFTVRLHELLRRERLALADFLVALAEFDERRLWVDLGHSSLFYFLHRELGLSKGAAFYRKTAVELIRRFPEVVDRLREGRLCLTSVVELAKVLTPENREEVLPRFFSLSKREAKEVSAEIRPDEAPPRRDVVTAVRPAAGNQALPFANPQRPDVAQAAVHPANQPDPGQASVHPANQPDRAQAAVHPANQTERRAIAPMPPRPTPDTVEPLTAELSRLHVTVPRRLLAKLDAARAALSHSHSGAATADVLEAALDLLLDRHAKRNGLVKKPRREAKPSRPDRVPAHVRRAVWKRDDGKCQFPLASGGICGSTLRLELDHHPIPRARGGPSTIENLRLCCAFHNDLAARQQYGEAWMDRYTRGSRTSGRPRSSTTSPPAPP
jgi:5-methylcytosine-specific restriction endonuclease McrA